MLSASDVSSIFFALPPPPFFGANQALLMADLSLITFRIFCILQGTGVAKTDKEIQNTPSCPNMVNRDIDQKSPT